MTGKLKPRSDMRKCRSQSCYLLCDSEGRTGERTRMGKSMALAEQEVRVAAAGERLRGDQEPD